MPNLKGWIALVGLWESQWCHAMLSSLSYHPRLASAYDAGLICLIPIFWLRLICLGTTPVSRYSIHQPLSFLSFSPSSLVVVTQRHCLLLKVTDDLLKNCSSSTRCLMFWSTDHIISFLLAFINLLKYCLHLYPPSRETALSLRKVLLFIIVSVAPRMEPCRCSENLGTFWIHFISKCEKAHSNSDSV